jgi:hypothetical protein
MHTVTWRLLCALLLCHAIGRTASAKDALMRSEAVTTSLRVDIIFDGPPMSPRLERSAMQEVALIWAAYGVDVSTLKASDRRRDGAVGLTVTLADGPDRRIATGALGSIRFVDDVPEPAIVMYPDVIASLVSTTRFGSLDLISPGAFHDLLAGRVMGRALAHEIGHFLLRSRQHSAAGLMRALQPAPDLVDPSRHLFGLSSDEVTRLAAMLRRS